VEFGGLPIDFSTVSDTDDDHEKLHIADGVDDTIPT
jgi:hypothetical protein